MDDVYKTFSHDDVMAMEKVPRLKMINAISGFKSANLLGTASSGGQENVAVFSSVIHLGSNPPLLGFVTRPQTVPRHTYQHIHETGWFTINHVNASIYEKAHQTSGKYREDLSEFEQCELTPVYSDDCPAPYVKEARIRMGMKQVEEHKIEANGTVLVVGSIEEIILTDDFLMDDYTLDLDEAGTVAISGLESYHATKRLDKLDYVRLPDEQSRD
jgi:flavin reductase (DIM6/NTAB) family NADH-FMN oxidoreductase RutF